MRYEIRPLGGWDRPITDPRTGSGTFRADWESTLDLLGREVELLGAQLVVVQIDAKDAELRRDGMLRSRVNVRFPGVKVSFESHHGPLTYTSDAYEPRWGGDPPGWQANVRAIALALQALRAVDRYGVSSRGEQYRGWTAITAGGRGATMSLEEAAALLAGGDHTALTKAQILAQPNLADTVYREAVKIYHPDRGGDPDLFDRLTRARERLVSAVMTT